MHKRNGFTIIELLVAGSLFAVFSSAFVVIFLQTFTNDYRQSELNVAMAFAREGIEIVRAMRKDGFPLLGTVTEGGFETVGGGNFRFDGAPDTTDKYERKITVVYAQRSGGDIAEGGSVDDKTMKVTSVVEWDSMTGTRESITLSTYIAYWEESL